MSPERLIEFEARWPRHNGTKEEAIRAELGMTPARFYQLLNRAARTAAGMRADALTARRVRARAGRMGATETQRFAAGWGGIGEGPEG